MATLLAILSALPKIFALVQFFAGMVRDAEQRGLGRKEAIAEAAEKAHIELALADAEDEKARRSHAEHPDDDSGFDPAGERKD